MASLPRLGSTSGATLTASLAMAAAMPRSWQCMTWFGYTRQTPRKPSNMPGKVSIRRQARLLRGLSSRKNSPSNIAAVTMLPRNGFSWVVRWISLTSKRASTLISMLAAIPVRLPACCLPTDCSTRFRKPVDVIRCCAGSSALTAWTTSPQKAASLVWRRVQPTENRFPSQSNQPIGQLTGTTQHVAAVPLPRGPVSLKWSGPKRLVTNQHRLPLPNRKTLLL